MRRLPTYWYPVDPAAKVIYDQPRRYRWQIYELAGVDVNGQWQRIRPAVLGWPDRPIIEAAILAVLYRDAHRWVSGRAWRLDALRRAVVGLFRTHGWTPQMRSFLSGIHRVHRDRLTESAHGCVRLRQHALSLGAAPSRIVAVRGRELGTAPYDAFDTVTNAPVCEGSAA